MCRTGNLHRRLLSSFKFTSAFARHADGEKYNFGKFSPQELETTEEPDAVSRLKPRQMRVLNPLHAACNLAARARVRSDTTLRSKRGRVARTKVVPDGTACKYQGLYTFCIIKVYTGGYLRTQGRGFVPVSYKYTNSIIRGPCIYKLSGVRVWRARILMAKPAGARPRALHPLECRPTGMVAVANGAEFGSR
jgi:hypothetical protein